MKATSQWTSLCAIVAIGLGVASATGQSSTASSSSSSSSRADSATLGTVDRSDKLIGRAIRNNNNQDIGKIADIIVDLESGRVLYAVVSVGGFLGMGDRHAAIPPGAFTEQGKELRLDADKEKLKNAPEFDKKEGSQLEMLSPSFISSVYAYFGQSAWWESGSSTTSSSQAFSNAHRASKLHGMDVKDTANTKVARVDDSAIDLPAGRVVFVVLEPDRSLEVKTKLIPVPPNALTPGPDKSGLITGVARGTLMSAPGIDKDTWSQLSNPSFAGRVYQHFGKQAYFQSGSELRPTSTTTNAMPRIYHESTNSP